MSPRYRTHNGDIEESLYRFAVIREEDREFQFCSSQIVPMSHV